MKPKFKLLFFALFVVSAAFSQQTPWPAVTRQTRPWTRWWWMGSAVDEPNISRLLKQYSSAGFGGVEITPIYGAVGFENKYIDFLSPKWVSMLDYSVKTAASLGMGVDMNTGTGWPFGGPQIKPELAASKLSIKTFQMSGGEELTAPLGVEKPGINEFKPRLQAIYAYGERTINLMDRVDANGKLNWIAPEGQWQVIAAFLDKTGQVVKRSAPGGAGYTMDHLYRPALLTYLSRFDAALGNTPNVRCFFNDSYEVYNADLSPQLFDEFTQRRGYDVRPYLRELVSKENNETIARIRTDYRETMSDMVLENFTQPWTKWINSKHAISRNQAHGSPGNVLDLYGAVDIPETETFGLTRFKIPGLNFYTNDTRNVPPDPLMLKFASSAAHVTGKNLSSSETFTWLGEHFKVPLSHCKAEVEQVFLAGINHVFYHGTSYSPEEAGYPGWLFYASVNFNPSNSLWPHLAGLNTYITRCQSILQSGKADNELLVYWPVYDAWNDGPAKLDMQLGVHTVDQWLQPTPFYKLSKGLMDSGYSVDFASDRQVLGAGVSGGRVFTAKGAGYKTLLVPDLKYMTVETLTKTLNLARAGATVIFQSLPADVPGYREFEQRRVALRALTASIPFKEVRSGVKMALLGTGKVLLSADPAAALSYSRIYRETLSDSGLKFIRRVNGTSTWYYLVNHGATNVDRVIPLNAAGNAVFLDPLTGAYGKGRASVTSGKTNVYVQLPPGQAIFVKVDSKPISGMPAWKYLGATGNEIPIAQQAGLVFSGGGPVLPKGGTLNKLASWTELPDPDAANFSGTATYTMTFDLPGIAPGEYVIDLGDVRESAHLRVNGRDAGILWSVPYRASIGKFLKAGKNTLSIEVANLQANRIRDLDRRNVVWRKYNEINFVNLNYLPFDASGWEVQPSGLLGPVTLSRFQTK